MISSSPSQVTIGMVQFPAHHDKATNIERALRLAEQAADQGAQIIAFHEMFMLPWAFATSADSRTLADRRDSPIFDAFRALAQSRCVVLVCSCYEAGEDGRYYNAAHVIDADGTTAGWYRKHHLPPDHERDHFSLPDDPIRAMDTAYGRLGVYVCWENFLPEGARLLALDGAQIVFAPTAATSHADAYRWEIALKAHALCNSLYWVRLNRVEPPFYGENFIVGPDGNFVVAPLPADERIQIAILDLTTIRLEREAWTYLADRRPTQYALLSRSLVDASGHQPEHQPESAKG